MARTIETYLNEATAAFEAGFTSKAAQKRAQENVSRAYEIVRTNVQDGILAARRMIEDGKVEGDAEAMTALYYAVPMELHHVRDRHYAEMFEGTMIRDLVALRVSIKNAPIAPAPVRQHVERAETVRRSILEIMEGRKEKFAHGLRIVELFGNLPVSVNVHIVHGHKGAVFLRAFYYMNGELTPLNTIIAVLEESDRRKEAA